MRSTDTFYLKQEEPNKSCFLTLRTIILKSEETIEETVKYGMPCFCIKGKPVFYLWFDKKTTEPYILFVDGLLLDHPLLESGSRKKMKVLTIDPTKDLPLHTINELLNMAILLKLK
ncbi:DUF1801 domain-containing protein [Flammeovirga sp. SubArs3]|uniref:DUF1801 domain-containing protein n=1 Tax=Flammeovirga sp. SubArs3 TaxID=2995316 RepID=UPI00248CAE50|nr:DUF1801 domain-containing protein [Flammeovirga sp. SubArs3]